MNAVHETASLASPADMRCLWQAGALLGEGPVWVARERALYWVDIKSFRLHRFEPGNETRSSWTVPEQISALHPAADGGFIAAVRGGFARVEIDGGRIDLTPLEQPEADRPDNRFNDGTIDAAGRFWAGSMDDGEREPTGALYCFEADGRCRVMDRDYVITNGPALSRDNRWLYHTDTLARRIYRFALSAQGTLSGRGVHIEIPEAEGYPDGMTVDAEDHLWVAHYGGARVSRFDPEGRKVGHLPLPVSNVTSCTFGGDGLDQLYITTAAKGLDAARRQAEPLAGGLFVCTPGVRGLPGQLFAAPTEGTA